MASELSKGKTMVILAIVVGCFAVLWPKIFYPMFQSSVAPSTTHQQQHSTLRERDPPAGTGLCCGVVFESDASSMAFLTELCSLVLKRRDRQLSTELLTVTGRPPERALQLCRAELLDKCSIDLDDVVKSDVDGAVVDRRLRSKFHGQVRAQNLTSCLQHYFDIDENLVRAKKTYHRPTDVFYPRHMRPERPPHLHPDNMHPALREKGRAIPPIRTIEKQAKPGPMPGMRPPMGGAGHIVSSPSGSGGMGVLMPIYTVAIVIFFLYTVMKILFKKPAEEASGNDPRFRDYHLDPEHRKFIFADEYCTGVVPGLVPEMTAKEYAMLQEQQQRLILQEQQRCRIENRSKTVPDTFANKDEDLEPIAEHIYAAKADESAQHDEMTKAEEENVEEDNEQKESKVTELDQITRSSEEEEADQLRRRLEETERAMERICRQMGDVAEKLSPAVVSELLAAHLAKESHESERQSLPKMSKDAGSDDQICVAKEEEEGEWDKVLRQVEESFERVNRGAVKPFHLTVKETEPEEDVLEPIQEQKLVEYSTKEAYRERLPDEQIEVDEVQTLQPTEEVAPTEKLEVEVHEAVAEDETKLTELEKTRNEHSISSETEILADDQVAVDSQEKNEAEVVEEAIITDSSYNLQSEIEPDETLVERKVNIDLAMPHTEESHRQSEERKLTVMGFDAVAEMEDHTKMPAELLPKLEKPHHAPKVEKFHLDPEHVKSVLLDKAIPPESHLVVSEAECSAEVVPPEQLELDVEEYESTPVVLSGKMVLSVIGMDLVAEGSDNEMEGPAEVVTPHVRFPPEPYEKKVYLIATDPEEELVPEDELPKKESETQLEEEEEIVCLPSVPYRPPTPPLQHVSDEESNEFLTYEELEEVGDLSAIEATVDESSFLPSSELCTTMQITHPDETVREEHPISTAVDESEPLEVNVSSKRAEENTEQVAPLSTVEGGESEKTILEEEAAKTDITEGVAVLAEPVIETSESAEAMLTPIYDTALNLSGSLPPLEDEVQSDILIAPTPNAECLATKVSEEESLLDGAVTSPSANDDQLSGDAVTLGEELGAIKNAVPCDIQSEEVENDDAAAEETTQESLEVENDFEVAEPETVAVQAEETFERENKKAISEENEKSDVMLTTADVSLMSVSLPEKLEERSAEIPSASTEQEIFDTRKMEEPGNEKAVDALVTTGRDFDQTEVDGSHVVTVQVSNVESDSSSIPCTVEDTELTSADDTEPFTTTQQQKAEPTDLTEKDDLLQKTEDEVEVCDSREINADDLATADTDEGIASEISNDTSITPCDDGGVIEREVAEDSKHEEQPLDISEETVEVTRTAELEGEPLAEEVARQSDNNELPAADDEKLLEISDEMSPTFVPDSAYTEAELSSTVSDSTGEISIPQYSTESDSQGNAEISDESDRQLQSSQEEPQEQVKSATETPLNEAKVEQREHSGTVEEETCLISKESERQETGELNKIEDAESIAKAEARIEEEVQRTTNEIGERIEQVPIIDHTRLLEDSQDNKFEESNESEGGLSSSPTADHVGDTQLCERLRPESVYDVEAVEIDKSHEEEGEQLQRDVVEQSSDAVEYQSEVTTTELLAEVVSSESDEGHQGVSAADEEKIRPPSPIVSEPLIEQPCTTDEASAQDDEVIKYERQDTAPILPAEEVVEPECVITEAVLKAADDANQVPMEDGKSHEEDETKPEATVTKHENTDSEEVKPEAIESVELICEDSELDVAEITANGIQAEEKENDPVLQNMSNEMVCEESSTADLNTESSKPTSESTEVDQCTYLETNVEFVGHQNFAEGNYDEKEIEPAVVSISESDMIERQLQPPGEEEFKNKANETYASDQVVDTADSFVTTDSERDLSSGEVAKPISAADEHASLETTESLETESVQATAARDEHTQPEVATEKLDVRLEQPSALELPEQQTVENEGAPGILGESVPPNISTSAEDNSPEQEEELECGNELAESTISGEDLEPLGDADNSEEIHNLNRPSLLDPEYIVSRLEEDHPEEFKLLQSAVSGLVQSIIAESLSELIHEKCDTETDTDYRRDLIAEENEEQLDEECLDRDLLAVDGVTNDALVDAKADFEQDREVPEIEHSLEQRYKVEVSTSENNDHENEVEGDENEEEPSISGFIIREDFPDEDDIQPMSEDEILQARLEIEEIKKLLADVSSGVLHNQSPTQTQSSSRSVLTDLAHQAMADEGVESSKNKGASKGSSPDIEEYEVVPKAIGDGSTCSEQLSDQQHP